MVKKPPIRADAKDNATTSQQLSKINPGDESFYRVDLLKGYAIQKPAQYSISYTGQGMSGLVVKDSVIFVYAKP